MDDMTMNDISDAHTDAHEVVTRILAAAVEADAATRLALSAMSDLGVEMVIDFVDGYMQLRTVAPGMRLVVEPDVEDNASDEADVRAAIKTAQENIRAGEKATDDEVDYRVRAAQSFDDFMRGLMNPDA